MRCRSCGGAGVGVLPQTGEPICGECAQMVSTVPSIAHVSDAGLRLHKGLADCRCQDRRFTKATEFVTPRDNAAMFAELRRRNDEWLFYGRAREAQARGGCRT